MTAKQAAGVQAPDGSTYVTLTDGAGNLGTTITAVSSDNLAQVGGTTVATSNGVVSAGVQRVAIASDNTAFSVNASSAQSGTWTVQPGNTANTTAWKVDGSAVTQPVSIASVPSHAVTNAGTFAVQATLPTSPATGTMSSVASSVTSVTVLASNANRKGASVYNDSTQILYLAVSATTASATAYTVQLAANAFFELPPCRDGSVYTGQLTGIWASANGNARVTEWT